MAVKLVEEPEQLAIFETMPVVQYRASLAAAGFVPIETAFKPGQRVTITLEGTVSKVTFIKNKDKKSGVRQHVIVVDQNTLEIAQS